MQFKVRRILPKNIKDEIQKTGFSPSYLDFGILKHQFLNIKIYNLKPEAATILKQTALSLGADVAVHRGVLDHSIQKSDVILSGSIAQIRTVCEKLKKQQFSMPKVADEILKQAEIFLEDTSKIPDIMGILNITENSFSDGGRFLNPNIAIEYAYKMIEDGARIIDIGAESTKPGADIIPPEIEIERISPVIKELRQNLACMDIKISIDTRNAETARKMAEFGADIINDVSGLAFDEKMADIIKETGVKIVIMHSRGTPKDMDNLACYKNTVDEIYFELQERVQYALNKGILPSQIIIDPGFGFAKNNEQNFEILSKIEEFKSMGYPLLAGLSRKRFIKSLDKTAIFNTGQDKNATENKCTDFDTLDFLTSGASLFLAIKGVDIIRVHDVLKTRQMLDLTRMII